MKRFLLALLLTFTTGAAFGQVYAAKFVCGKATANEINNFVAAPGSYFTAINVRNAAATQITIRKRFSLGLRDEKVGKLSGFFSTTIPPAQTMLVDCGNIWKHMGIAAGTFIEGYAELRPIGGDIDVVSVFTVTPPGGGVASIHTERVPRRAQ